MPVAHLMVQSVGSMHSLLRQSQLLHLSANPQPISDEARRAIRADWAMSNARNAAEKGNRLICRMAFWSAFGLLAAPMMSRLADKLNRVSDGVERHIAMAA